MTTPRAAVAEPRSARNSNGKVSKDSKDSKDSKRGKPSTRERIIHQAAVLFAANGYHATGIAELLDAVEVSRGTFYYHVDSKETLLFEISRNQVRRMNEVADEIMASELVPSERMRMLSRSLLRNIADYDAEWTVFFREFDALQGDGRDEILRERERYEKIWLQVLREGSDRGEFEDVSPLHVKGILGMLNYSYLWLNPGGPLNAEQIADSFVDLLLNGLRKRS